MSDIIYRQIMRHIDLMETSIRQAKAIRRAACEKDIDAVIWETENRDKVINIISMFQRNIEDAIESLKVEDVTKDLIDTLKFWTQDVAKWVDKTNQIDQEVVNILESEKEQTTKEIATLFQSKNKFKGYNLNDLKK